MSNSEQPKRKITSKQVIAMIGVILLVLLYLVTLLVAIFDNSSSGNLFWICLISTMVIPIIIWLYAWMWNRLHAKDQE